MKVFRAVSYTPPWGGAGAGAGPDFSLKGRDMTLDKVELVWEGNDLIIEIGLGSGSNRQLAVHPRSGSIQSDDDDRCIIWALAV